MKKILLFSLMLFLCGMLAAQNLQLHYDFGHSMNDELSGRQRLTSTIEMFKPDAWGSTFFFVDLDYHKGVQGAYWEISRELCFWQKSSLNRLSAHLEYNGGCATGIGSFHNAWLAGPTYSGHSKDYSKTWSLSLLYKYIPHTVALNGTAQEHNYQITGVWGIHFAHGWCTFSGFFDFWREARPWQNTTHIFLSEPQFWVNLNKMKACEKLNLSLGGEVEISNNFAGSGFYAIPTLAVKWTF